MLLVMHPQVMMHLRSFAVPWSTFILLLPDLSHMNSVMVYAKAWINNIVDSFFTFFLLPFTESTETTPAPQFNRQFTLKLITENCNLLKVMTVICYFHRVSYHLQMKLCKVSASYKRYQPGRVQKKTFLTGANWGVKLFNSVCFECWLCSQTFYTVGPHSN